MRRHLHIRSIIEQIRSPILLAVVALTWSLAVPSAHGQEASPTIYRLNPDGSYQQGCFPPCLCPVLQRTSVRGTFSLTFAGFDGLFENYTVTDVNWTVSQGDSELRVTGSGTYRVGGEFALVEQLTLDLKVGDMPVQHFDSGLVVVGAASPNIRTSISLHGQYCFDTVFVVSASPVPAEQIHPYALTAESMFQRGCFPPCFCALWARPVSGTFALVDVQQTPLFSEFTVVDVDWLVDASSSGSPDIAIRGVGTYRVGGEVASQQQLSLDLTVGDEDPAHFDSGVVPGGGDFPLINSQISINGMRCFDTVIDVHAGPRRNE